MAFSDCSVSDLWNESGDLYLPMIVEMNTSLVDVADKTLLTHVSEDLDLENAVYNN